MSRRLRSVELMKYLQPFTQSGFLNCKEAQSVVREYASGNDEPVKALIYSPTLPMGFHQIAERLRVFISND